MAHDVNGAMKKSWKSAANFDSEIPTFTPFNHGDDSGSKVEPNLSEVPLKTTESSLSPSPSAETLTSSKISSKFKAPSKYVADIYKQQSAQKTVNKDFGAFDGNVMHDDTKLSEEHKNEIIIEDEHIDFEQIIGQLNDEADKAEPSDDNTVDELEISTIANDDTNTTQYKVGPLMNVTIDSDSDSVNVNLDQKTLKEIFTGSRSHAIRKALGWPSKNNKKNFFSHSRPRQEKRVVGARRSIVHLAVPHPVGRRSLHGDNDQALSDEVAVRWKDCHSVSHTRRTQKPPKRNLHEVNAALAVLPQGLPAALPRATL